MNRLVAPILLFVLGAVAVQQVVFGGYVDYVRPGHGPLLATAGGLLTAVGLWGVVAGLRAAPEESAGAARLARARVHTRGPLAADRETLDRLRAEEQAEGHDHARVPGVGWLLVLPVFLVLLVPPPALGAFAASRAGAEVPRPAAVATEALAGPDPVPVALHDYAERAAWDDGRTLAGHTVVLTGFVTPREAGGWYLSRMVISCCAADARSYLVEVAGAPTERVPAKNSWQQVTGTYAPGDGTHTARITALEVRPVAAPQDPYEVP
ncbi:TIGR03943 family protein [Pseudonocardia sp. RS11V-5]|uniref:TIGR03943 family putative permease subunit n=1 Tax=Pseudonocardia terrae TaxID=2905831 RepID=UPI001E577EA8|nr:TIGR03943 family protein [Pseudonocardia terrae]MCE3550629.1 TIGR03943 family protein [Pseudonocardia terrae]